MEKSKTVIQAFSRAQLILNLISGKFFTLKWILIERATQEKRPQIDGVPYLTRRWGLYSIYQLRCPAYPSETTP